MTVKEAAISLNEHLQNPPWLTTIGVGNYENQPTIYLYVKTLKSVPQSIKNWEGYRVIVKKLNKIKPVDRGAP